MEILARLNATLGGRYALQREIGHGGTATVFQAADLRHERTVAIKVLRPGLTASVTGERFVREIRIAAQLDHPHVLALIDSGEADGLLYYVMPYVEGESLRDRLQREQRLPVDEAVGIAREVADGLQYAHDQGVIHRDIKPGNILLSHGHARILDFGIARALELAGEQRLTWTGSSPGTCAYMSPEQGFGEGAAEASDVYSLACVLYEMLVGDPPFLGSNRQAVLAQHAFDSAAPIRSIRAEVPEAVEAALAKALAKDPSQRFASVRDFSDALNREAPPSNRTGLRRPAPGLPRMVYNHPLRAGVGLLIAFLILAAIAFVIVPPLARWARSLRDFNPTVLDSRMYLVLPFAVSGAESGGPIDGDQARRLVLESLSSWDDLTTADPVLVSEILDAWGAGAIGVSQDSALSTATRLGAGLLVRGVLTTVGDTTQAEAILYDVSRGGARLSIASTRFPSASGPETAFGTLTDSLVSGAIGAPRVDEAIGQTRSYQALVHYGRAQVALDSFELTSAVDLLAEASRSDSLFGAAAFWSAQIMAWVRDTSADWRSSAARAASLTASSAEPQRSSAAALQALASRRYRDACRIYRDLVEAHPLDYVAWAGLGDCHAWDHVVVADPSSPSGWRFRGSAHSAVQSYRRALAINPRLYRLFSQIDVSDWIDPLFVEPHRLRPGYAAGSDSVAFLAYPSIEGDSLSFVPHPADDVLMGLPSAVPSTHQAALTRNLDILRELAVDWTRRDSQSAWAFETLALLLERRGDLTEASAPEVSALESIRVARALSRDSADELRLALTEVRLNVKLARFSAAGALADSLLERWPDPSAGQAQDLAGLAALAGRAHRAADLMARSAPSDHRTPDQRAAGLETAPRPVAQQARALLAYAAFGVPKDSLVVLSRRVNDLVDIWIEPAQRTATRRRLMDRAMELAFPALGLTDLHRADAGASYLLSLQWALLSGDTATVASTLTGLDQAREGMRAVWVTPENIYQESQLALAIGDTGAAVRRLEPLLNSLPALRSDFLDEPTRVAGLVRCMVQRAELAEAAGDKPIARRWARAVLDLWREADAELEPLLEQLKAFEPGN